MKRLRPLIVAVVMILLLLVITGLAVSKNANTALQTDDAANRRLVYKSCLEAKANVAQCHCIADELLERYSVYQITMWQEYEGMPLGTQNTIAAICR